MKSVLLSLVLLSTTAALAMETESRLTMPETVQPKMNSTEFSLLGTSFNSGSMMSAIAAIHEFDNGYALGARGLLPLTTGGEAQVYMAQLFSRVYLTNDENITYFEVSLGEVFFNQPSGTDYTASIGLEYGYKRQITNQFSAGASMGVEYAGARMANDNFYNNTGYLYNKLGLNASYYY